MALIKKTAAYLMILLFFFVSAANAVENQGISEIRYRLGIQSDNPLWCVLFFLFESDNKEFLWREKEGLNQDGHYREFFLFNRSRRVVVNLFSQNKIHRGKIDFGKKELRGELKTEQAEILFEIKNFIRSAKVGDAYRADFKTSNDYKIFIEARNFFAFRVGDDFMNTLYFEGKITKVFGKKEDKFIEAGFWVAKERELTGQIIKCFFKKSFWPPVLIQIAD